jgi:fatty acid desaturase
MANTRTISASEFLDKPALAAFMRCTNWQGLLFVAGHVATLAAGVWLVWATLGAWWVAPAMVLHGIVVVHLFAPLHECAHFTAFKSRGLNRVVGVACGVAIGVPFLFFRLEHIAHHRFTQDRARDPQLIPLAAGWAGHVWYLSSIPYWQNLIGDLVRHALGRYRPAEREFLRDDVLPAVTREARLMLLFYVAILAGSVALQSWAALVYWLGPRILGEPFMRAIRMSEHVGCDEDPDMLKNTRTVAHPLAPVRWLAWNMCWHTAHHYQPGVPFHLLPKFHAIIGRAVVHSERNYLAAHRHIFAMISARRGA